MVSQNLTLGALRKNHFTVPCRGAGADATFFSPHSNMEYRGPVTKPASEARKIVLFDGVCNLCDWFVNFVFRRDGKKEFYFAPLQSKLGRELVNKYGLDPDITTVVLVDEHLDKAFTQSYEPH